MAFTLNDTELALGRDTLADSNVPKLSEVRNILFESAYMPTFVRNECTTDNTEMARSSDEMDRDEGLEPVYEDDFEDEEEMDDSAESDDEDEGDDSQQQPELQQPVERIKVFLRIRPEKMAPNYEIDGNGKVLWVTNLTRQISRTATMNYFKFDHIFHDSSEQWPVVKECSLPLLKDFILGENSLLFTYGITSSGKSFTMRGTRKHLGIIPANLVLFFEALKKFLPNRVPEYKPIEFSKCKRLSTSEKVEENGLRLKIVNHSLSNPSSMEEMEAFQTFASSLISEKADEIYDLTESFEQDLEPEALAEKKVECGVWIAYYEIYNDKIYDLLELNPSCKRSRGPSKLSISTNDKKQVFINGLRHVYVTSAIEAYYVFLFGQDNLKKHIVGTALNHNSSRSHSSFNMTLVCVDKLAESAVISNITFCDLAGRERTKKSGVTKMQLNEANAINSSLMHLGQCISGLRSQQNSTNAAQVTYRNSKLTHIFQPYLSGDGGRTYIIYNLNPKQELFDDSYYSLDFCSMAKEVKQNQIRSKAIQRLERSRQSIKADLESSFVEDGQDKLMCSIREDMSNISVMLESSYDQQQLLEQVNQLKSRILELEQQKLSQEMEIKCKTFEELDKMAKNYEDIFRKKERAIESVRDIYEERLKFTVEQSEKDLKHMKEIVEKSELQLFEQHEIVGNLNSRLEEMSVAIESRDITISNLQKDISEQTKILREKDETILNLRNESHSISMEVDGKCRRLEQQVAELTEQLSNQSRELQQKEQAIQSERDIYEGRLKVTVEQSEKDLKHMKEIVDKGERKLFEQYEIVGNLNSRLEEMSVAIESRDITISNFQRDISKMETTILEQTNILREKDETILNLRNESHSISMEVDGKCRRLEQQVAELTEQLSIQSRELQQKTSAHDQTLGCIRDEYHSKVHNFEETLQLKEKAIAELKRKLEEQTASWKTTSEKTLKDIKRKDCLIDELDARVGHRDKKVEELDHELSDTLHAKAQIEQEKALIAEQLAAMQAKNAQLEALVQRKDIELSSRRADLLELQTSKTQQINNLSRRIKELEEQSSKFHSEESGIRLSDASSVAQSESSFESNQENLKPAGRKKNSAKTRGGRSKKTTLAASRKPKISADEMEILRTVTKSNKNASVDRVPEDELIRCFSARKDLGQFSTAKKKLFNSTTKHLDTSPITSPMDALAHIDTASQECGRPYNTRPKRNRRKLFDL